MKKSKVDDLQNVIGGSTSITGTVISAITDIIRVLEDAGKGLGSAIRRMSENEICPLK